MTLPHLILLAAALFSIGLIGALTRRTPIVIFMSIELMLLASTLALVSFSRFTGNSTGLLFVFFILAIAAAEVAVGLAIIVALFRRQSSLPPESTPLLKH